MSTNVFLVDVFALLLAILGFHMAFRQRLVRRWWRALRPRDPVAPPPATTGQDEDPAHYALIIFGIMMMAFGIILFSFTTLYSVLTADAAP